MAPIDACTAWAMTLPVGQPRSVIKSLLTTTYWTRGSCGRSVVCSIVEKARVCGPLPHTWPLNRRKVEVLLRTVTRKPTIKLLRASTPRRLSLHFAARQRDHLYCTTESSNELRPQSRENMQAVKTLLLALASACWPAEDNRSDKLQSPFKTGTGCI